jgi:hypothetical protein
VLVLAGCGSSGTLPADASVDTTTTDSTSCAIDPFACYDGAVDEGGDAGLQPPLPCPANAPEAGAPCDLPNYEDCEYGATSAFDCSQHFSCWSGHWQVSQTSPCKPPEACPSDPPDGGCSSWGEECAYGDAGIFCVCTVCGVGPPPPDGYKPTWRCRLPDPGCSAVRPDDGTPCDSDAGCSYSAASCCTGAYSRCVDGVWLGGATDVCP